MDEPTVLDYVKALLTPWKGPAPAFPAGEREQKAPSGDDGGADQLAGAVSTQAQGETAPVLPPVAVAEIAGATPSIASRVGAWPWRASTALVLALLAQRSLEPPDRGVFVGVAFYLLAALLIVWAFRRGELILPAARPSARGRVRFSFRLPYLLAGLTLSLLAFLTFQDNLFSRLNVLLWTLGLALTGWAFWQGDLKWREALSRVLEALRRPRWQLNVSRWTLAVVAVVGLALFFRLFRLETVPPEMFSDHAEKLQDVADVLAGETYIFFPRNTGREAVQMYLTAAVARVFGTGLSFLSLKIGTALAGLVALPFVYLLGKEVGNRRIGLLAAAFAGIAYWPNVISRVALRFSLYPLFTAPTLYFLFRGLRTGNRNNFILAGLFLGLGLHGYSPFRFVPIAVVLIVGLFLLHRQAQGRRLDTLLALLIVALISLIVFLPLLRYAMDVPEMFFYRTLTRIGSTEQPIEDPLGTFFKNLWEASVMFFWSNGGTWVHSVVLRPALDVVSGALYGLGVVVLLVRYLRDRHWAGLALLVSVPLLLMPSVLSLAFPDENPSLNRTGGALVPVFVIVAFGLEGLISRLADRLRSSWARPAALALASFLLAWSAVANYDLVFRQYFRQFQLGAWNTTEIGQVIHDFAHSVGDRDQAWVVPNPHWVDTRLVGINAGFPEKDYALWPEDFDQSLELPPPKLFIVRPGDENALNRLSEMYPAGQLSTYFSTVENKDFLLYFVPR